ncbi:MAG: enoyl-CoA hydratase-related protein [Chloroflexota bacterium]|jgi:2-(1,2-epoxy-1,2-dihydrophenyl)acetyl-CoA isomerase
MTYETIHLQVDDSVATIAFNRPASLNAFSDQMIAESIEALEECTQRESVRCIVLTGSGRAFSAGQDLKELRSKGESFSIGDHVRTGYNRLVEQIVTVEKPVIGAINGVAAGAGCGIALATDVRIAAHTATFKLAFSRIGLVPDSGLTWTLPRLVGMARAFELAATDETVGAEKALHWGLVNQVVPADQLAEVVAAWAQLLASGPASALGLTKRAFARAASGDLISALAYEAELQAAAGRSKEFAEGLSAFFEKRDPEFRKL